MQIGSTRNINHFYRITPTMPTMLQDHPYHAYHVWSTSVIEILSYLIVSEMTYNVSSGTLNSTIPYHTCS